MECCDVTIKAIYHNGRGRRKRIQYVNTHLYKGGTGNDVQILISALTMHYIPCQSGYVIMKNCQWS